MKTTITEQIRFITEEINSLQNNIKSQEKMNNEIEKKIREDCSNETVIESMLQKSKIEVSEKRNKIDIFLSILKTLHKI